MQVRIDETVMAAPVLSIQQSWHSSPEPWVYGLSHTNRGSSCLPAMDWHALHQHFIPLPPLTPAPDFAFELNIHPYPNDAGLVHESYLVQGH